MALSSEQAAAVIGRRASDSKYSTEALNRRILTDKEYARVAIRIAASKTHPDTGGSTSDFQLVQEAKRVLEAHHGGTL